MNYIDQDKQNKRRGKYTEEDSELEIYACIYLIENLLSNKKYGGVSYAKEHPFDRNYKSSSLNKDYWKDYKDHPESFQFTILMYFDTKREAQEAEKLLVTKKEVEDPSWYNLSTPDYGFVLGTPDSQKKAAIARNLSDKIKRLKGERTNHEVIASNRLYNNIEKSKRGEKMSTELCWETRRRKDKVSKEKGELSSGEKTWKQRLKDDKEAKKRGILTSSEKSALTRDLNFLRENPDLLSSVEIYSPEGEKKEIGSIWEITKRTSVKSERRKNALKLRDAIFLRKPLGVRNKFYKCTFYLEKKGWELINPINVSNQVTFND